MSGIDIFMVILGYMGAIGISIFSSPELVRCIKTKKTSGVNVYLFGLLMFSSACFFISGFYNVSKEIALGATDYAFSLAVAVANVFSFIVPLIILLIKASNIIKAKKLGITEKEYEERMQKSKQAQ